MYLINKDETEHTGQVNVVLFVSLSKNVFLKQTNIQTLHLSW